MFKTVLKTAALALLLTACEGPAVPVNVARLKVDPDYKERVTKVIGEDLGARVKNTMNDPDSYQPVHWSVGAAGKYMVVVHALRGKNAFGAVVLNYQAFVLDSNLTILEQTNKGLLTDEEFEKVILSAHDRYSSR